MYDLHTHTLYSDGVLIPAELVRRYQAAGYQGVVLSDHVDTSNIETVLLHIVKFCTAAQTEFDGIKVLPGCEITHVPPGAIASMVTTARRLGARMVLVHGETLVEPVAPGTNLAGIRAGADIIAHPGLISETEILLAKERNVALEITSRSGHSYANGHVAALARKLGVRLTYSSDCHEPRNILPFDMVRAVLQGAGLTAAETETVLNDTADLFISKCA